MPYGYGFYWDPTYILVVIGAVICMIASARVRTTYSKYERCQSMSGMTGAQAAEQILRAAGIHDVRICHVSGRLTDHYDPRNKTLNLSDAVYASRSVAAIGVAAHECGHAIQHDVNYVPLNLRSAIVPVANSRYRAVFTGSAVSACDTSGRVQCVTPRTRDARGYAYFERIRAAQDEKSAARGGAHLCGECGSSHFTDVTTDHFIWRAK